MKLIKKLSLLFLSLFLVSSSTFATPEQSAYKYYFYKAGRVSWNTAKILLGVGNIALNLMLTQNLIDTELNEDDEEDHSIIRGVRTVAILLSIPGILAIKNGAKGIIKEFRSKSKQDVVPVPKATK